MDLRLIFLPNKKSHTRESTVRCVVISIGEPGTSGPPCKGPADEEKANDGKSLMLHPVEPLNHHSGCIL